MNANTQELKHHVEHRRLYLDFRDTLALVR
jgi:hypothetical protein